MKVISANKVDTKLVLTNVDIVNSLEEIMRGSMKSVVHDDGYASPMYDRPAIKEPSIIILDTRDLIDRHVTEMEMLGTEVDIFDITEVLTQAVTRLLASGEKQTADDICGYMDYSRMVNDELANGDTVSAGIVTSFENMIHGLIHKLEEHGMNQGQEFNYAFDRLLGNDIVLRRLSN